MPTTTTPFDPIVLASDTEKQVWDGTRRKLHCGNPIRYRHMCHIIRCDIVGCNLRCAYCWTGKTGEVPPGDFPAKTVDEILTECEDAAGKHERDNPKQLPVGFGFTGGEPTASFTFLLAFLDRMKERTPHRRLFLETNSVLLGHDPSYLQRLAAYAPMVELQFSIRAGTPGTFQRLTGAEGRFWNHPFRAIEWALSDSVIGIIPCSVTVVANVKIIPADERRKILSHLFDISLIDKALCAELMKYDDREWQDKLAQTPYGYLGYDSAFSRKPEGRPSADGHHVLVQATETLFFQDITAKDHTEENLREKGMSDVLPTLRPEK